MIRWQVENGIIKKIFWEGKNLIRPWGIETADSYSFFSLDNSVGYKYHVKSKNIIENEKIIENDFHIEMKEGEFRLRSQDKLYSDNVIKRNAEIEFLEDTYIMDFVIRYRFLSSNIDFVSIDDNEIFHTDSNIYHQYPVNKVELHYKNKTITIRALGESEQHGLKRYMYVRDNNDEWIVHIRLLPQEYDKLVIKLCSKWFKTMPLAPILTKTITKSNRIKDILWYRSEREPYRSKFIRIFNPNCFPMIKLKKDSSLIINSELSIIENETKT